jgi:predicted transcriptional regulator YdeE
MLAAWRVHMRLSIALVAMLLLGQAIPDKHRTPSAVTHASIQEPLYVAGYMVRTNNASEAAGNGKIGELWQRFMQQDLGAKIPDRTDPALIVVYSDYASDEKGDYDYLLGAHVFSIGKLPEGMTYKQVKPGNYACIETETGQMPDVLQAAWKRIGQMSREEMGGQRAFVTDYEVYDGRSADPKHARVPICVGLKPPTL